MDSDFSVLSVFEWGDGCGAHSLLIRSFLSFETRLLYAVARSGDTVGVGRGGPQHLDPPCGLRQLTTHPTSPLSPCLLFVCLFRFGTPHSIAQDWFYTRDHTW